MSRQTDQQEICLFIQYFIQILRCLTLVVYASKMAKRVDKIIHCTSPEEWLLLPQPNINNLFFSPCFIKLGERVLLLPIYSLALVFIKLGRRVLLPTICFLLQALYLSNLVEEFYCRQSICFFKPCIYQTW